jgi:hypothetical protein
MGAMSKYKEYFNAACEQRYKLSRYRRELSVAENLRAAEEKKRVEIAAETHTSKERNVRGFKEREEAKEALRESMAMTLQVSGEGLEPKWKASVFNDLK